MGGNKYTGITGSEARNSSFYMSLDFGLMMPFSSDTENFIGIPWLGFTIPIENKNK